MKDKLDNLKNSTNDILKDIRVTDELKEKTLEKCKNSRKDSNDNRNKFLKAASIILIVFSIGTVIYKLNNRGIGNITNIPSIAMTKTKNEPNIVQNNSNKVSSSEAENLKTKNLKTKNKKVNNSINKPVNKSDKSTGSVQRKTSESKKSINKNKNPTVPSDAANDPEVATIAPEKDTYNLNKIKEKYGKKIYLPQYIPKGFVLKDVNLSEDLSEIELLYSYNNISFKLTEKNPVRRAPTFGLTGDKDDNKITLDGTEITLEGNLNEQELENIKKSIK